MYAALLQSIDQGRNQEEIEPPNSKSNSVQNFPTKNFFENFKISDEFLN